MRKDVMKVRGLGLLCLALLAVPSLALAAGTVSGVVVDGFTGQPVRGATVVIEGVDTTATTDLGGVFLVQIEAGSYTVVVSRDGFESQRVTGVVVTDGEVADFAVVLLPAAGTVVGEVEAEGADAVADAAAFAGEITVTADAVASTEAALLAERKGAAQISDSIGSDEIKKGTGSDAADAVKRVTGISLQNDKYVFVRGLGERYSNTALNGAKIPSTEFEKKVVPLDIFPAGLLEKIKVSKSYTVDRPGDFAAGFVDLETLDFPAQQQMSIGFGLGSNSNATGERFGQYLDGLDFGGGGGQPLPSAIPNTGLFRQSPITGEGFTQAELQEFGHEMVGQWSPTYDPSAPYDPSFSLSYGNTFGRLGLVVSATHGHDYKFRDEQVTFYRYSELTDSGVAPMHEFDIEYATEKVKRGAVANFAYKIDDNHHLKLRTLYSDLSTATTRFQEGFFEDMNSNIRDTEVNYKNQNVQTAQLSGEHFFDTGSVGSLLEWRGTISTAETEENLRITNYAETFTGSDVYLLTDNAQSGFMYFNDLEEDLQDAGVDWTKFLNGLNWFGSLKVGAAYTDRDRSFFGRRLRFRHLDTRGIDKSAPPEEIFTEENISPNGFEIEEITRPTDTYDAVHEVTAGYAQMDWGSGKWRVIGGLRFEDSTIDVTTLDRYHPDTPPILTTVEDSDVLPSVNVVYQVKPNANIRFSASETVNRPEFRELAPFKFVSLAGGFEVSGNPDLVTAKIQSYDLRWEWFPNSNDVIAVSLFAKEFDDPIEQVLVQSVARTQTFQNAVDASNMGLELEFRRNLGVLSPTLENWMVVFNYAYIDSEITIPEGSPLTNQTRPLVGQPDQVANVVLEWLKPEWSSSVRLLYNYSGETVAFAGANFLPDVIEEPRSTLDLAIRKSFSLWGQQLNLKLSAENLTDHEWEYTQGGEIWRLYKPGRKIGISFGLTFS